MRTPGSAGLRLRFLDRHERPRRHLRSPVQPPVAFEDAAIVRRGHPHRRLAAKPNSRLRSRSSHQPGKSPCSPVETARAGSAECQATSRLSRQPNRVGPARRILAGSERQEILRKVDQNGTRPNSAFEHPPQQEVTAGGLPSEHAEVVARKRQAGLPARAAGFPA